MANPVIIYITESKLDPHLESATLRLREYLEKVNKTKSYSELHGYRNQWSKPYNS